MGNRPKPKMRGLEARHILVDEWAQLEALAEKTEPLVGRFPTTKEKQMNAQSPVSVVTENDPTTSEDTVVTTRFNRKNLIRYAGAAAAVVGVVAVVFAVGKSSGRDEALEDVESLNDSDETQAS